MKKGFTLIELLIVIALIAILAAAVIIGLNPARQFSQARNSQRWSHVNALMNAVNQNVADNNGLWTCAEGALPATAKEMTSVDGASNYDICSCLVTTYISSMPFDPSDADGEYANCTDYTTGYTITQSAATNRVTIAAPSAELGATISVTN